MIDRILLVATGACEGGGTACSGSGRDTLAGADSALSKTGLLHVPATDTLKSAQLKPAQVDDMRLDPNYAHLLATDKALHGTPPQKQTPPSPSGVV